MQQPMENFIIELIQKGDPTVLTRIPNYIQQHMVQYGRNASMERDRVAQSVADGAISYAITDKVVDLIRAQKA
jgi:hypothetical protein